MPKENKKGLLIAILFVVVILGVMIETYVPAMDQTSCEKNSGVWNLSNAIDCHSATNTSVEVDYSTDIIYTIGSGIVVLFIVLGVMYWIGKNFDLL